MSQILTDPEALLEIEAQKTIVHPKPHTPIVVPATAPSLGVASKKEREKMTDMVPVKQHFDIDMNKGAGVDPALAMLAGGNRGGDGLFGGNGGGLVGGILLGTLFRGGGLFGGNGEGVAAAAVASGETKDAIYSSSLAGINATHASQLSSLQSDATTNLAIATSSADLNKAICDVATTVAQSQALVQGAVAQVGLESCRQFGALSTELAIQNGTTRTEAVASEARLSTTILQGQNALSASLMSGFNQTERGQDSINQNILLQSCSIKEAIKDCCCETQKGILATQNQISMSEMRTAQAISASTASILERLTNDKISDLQDSLAQARLAASQADQTKELEAAINAKLNSTLTPLLQVFANATATANNGSR